MHCVTVLAYFQCLKALEQAQAPKEEHVVDHKAEKWFELKVRRARWRVLDCLFDLVDGAIFFDEVGPGAKLGNHLGV